MLTEKYSSSWTDVALVMLIIALLSVGFWAMLMSANIPDVHVSNSTGECVEVINYDERFNYTCETLPSKYNHIWVK